MIMKQYGISTLFLIFILPGIVYGFLLWHLVRSDLAKDYGIFHYPSRASSMPEYSVGAVDFLMYASLAENLVDHGVFSVSERPPYLTEYQRTLGYPLFVALLLSVFHNYIAVAIAQIELVILTGYLILKLWTDPLRGKRQ